MLPHEPTPPRCGGPDGALARSVALFRAFRVEQTDPAVSTERSRRTRWRRCGRWVDLDGASVLDVGGGPGYFADAFAAAGARYAGLEPDAGEMTAAGDAAGNTVRGSGRALPIARPAPSTSRFSSNVLEHVPDPVRWPRTCCGSPGPGGVVFLSLTPWLSPWGGHETSPWHYLGRPPRRRPVRAAARPPTEERPRPHALRLPCRAMVRWARRVVPTGRAEVLAVLPRYHPSWASGSCACPGCARSLSWNAVIVLRRIGG